MIRRPPRSTQSRSSATSDVYKRQNYDSRKGHELAENPSAALTFYWPDLEREVCVAGTVSKLPPDESEAYFKSRPRGSRLAAWASNQSDVVADRATLEKKWN